MMKYTAWKCLWKKNGLDANGTIDEKIISETRYCAMEIFFG
ncbi:unnamed protein product [Nezara viridula]|uniref:Uncharacterized protein n=1 Tax=Nezara viridula TaxID=85310 RepID=A0A9P0HQZ8_NEZVI|nr:unnamed protein product [Nezara viridula]